MKIKKLHINISLLIFILSLIVVIAIYPSLKPQNTIETPRASAGEITIITPENKTYTEPMSGYYPGTFGFENDLNGAIPFNWIDTSSPPCYAKIINDIGGHNKVMEVYGRGQTSSDYAIINNYFQPQTSGTIEWWWRKSSALSSCAKFDVSYDTNELIDLRMDWYADPGKIEYEENGWINTGYSDYADDKWIHMKLSFNCTTDEYSLNIDGVLYLNNLPFHNGDTSTYINNIRFYTYAASNPTLYFVDAVGYSWDSNYDIGDNLNEGLLLSYENTTSLDWKCYSLDGNANKTILNNTTIPMLSNGLHSIQIFGNNSLGSMYESNLRYFTVETDTYINMITPENKTYTEPMSGYYPATYGFENEEDGELGTEVAFITRYDSDHSEAYARIEENINGHNKVLKFYDAATSDSYNFYAYHDFPTKIPYGTIEFWVLNTEYSGDQTGIYYHFSNSSGAEYVSIETFNNLFYLIIDGDNNGLVKLQTGNGESAWSGIYSDDTWHHIRIDFESSLGGYLGLEQYKLNFWFDGIQLLSNEPLIINDSLGVIASHSHGWDNTRHDYLDAIGFSWDTNYDIGDNLNENLLLSYDSITTLDWQGYSLDSQKNVTITGNTTLLILSNGLHSVQIFGNDSIGNNYQSNLIYFTVSFNNIEEPELTNGNVSPRIGDQTTEFNFTVTFWDEENSLPSYVNVVINGTACAMEKTFPSDDNYTNGCYYEYTTFLLPSEYNYTYYFECSDGKYTNTTTVFNNLKVDKVNYNSPQLLFPEVSPDYGGLTTDFVFNIWYYDLDDNYPLDINITIDAFTFSMIQVNSADTNATDGIEFFYITNLDYGIHNYQFNCSDGLYSNSTNWIIGPEVNPLYGIDLIELLTPSSYSQIYSNVLNFSWSSLDDGFGVVNFTLQVSNVTDFSHIIFQSENIAETPIVTNFSVLLSITDGDYYWRVCPTYGNYNGSWSEYFSFTFHVNNYAPNLVLDNITPTNGTSSTIFRFTVIYSDLDNNIPEYVEILINGIPYSMEMVDPLDEDFTDGCIYQYLTLLTPSTTAYTISFECSDGAFQYSTSTYQGPLVEPDSTPSTNQGDNNINSANTFAITMTLGITIGILIPFIYFTEKQVRKMKLGEKSSTKIKKKEIKS